MIVFVLMTLISFNCSASTKKIIGDVRVSSHWEGKFKVFKAEIEMHYQADLETVAKGIENFDEKCNNEYRSKRKRMKWGAKCLYHNKNLIEAVKIHQFNMNSLEKREGETIYLVWRNIYNRGTFSHYDVVRTRKEKGRLFISHEMLPPEKVNSILAKPEKSKSAFEFIKGTYILDSVGDKQTKVKYIYESKTTHWLLTKDFIEENVFENMSNGTTQALKTISKSIQRNTRSL